MLYMWILIDEKVQSKLFWMIAFSIYFLLSLLVFAYTLSGVVERLNQKNDDTIRDAWYYPLYNGNQNILYEVILMIVIILQVYFAKQYGVYYKSL